MTENYYDGEWRPVTTTDDRALEKLRQRGFEFGALPDGRLMARWPIAPAAPTLPTGVRIIHSHGRYIASDGSRFGGWSATEEGAIAKWHKQKEVTQ